MSDGMKEQINQLQESVKAAKEEGDRLICDQQGVI